MAGDRPTVATVFGILHCIFGGFGLLGIFGLGVSFRLSVVNGILVIIGLAVSALLLAAGIFMLMNKKMAVDLCKYYVFASIGITVIRLIYTIIAYSMAVVTASIFVYLIGLIYPLLVWFLIVQKQEVVSFYSAQAD